MKKQQIFWGIFFIAAAALIIISKLGMMPDVGVFTILVTAFLLWALIKGISHINFYEILFPIAFLCIIYDEPLGIEALTPWSVLAAAFLLSIGLSMLFHGKNFHGKRSMQFTINDGHRNHGNYAAGSEQCSDEHLVCENYFGSVIRYINSDNFCDACLKNNFGNMTIYFDNAIVQGESAQVEIENHFGVSALYIPKEWKVRTDLAHSFGDTKEYGTCIGSSDTTLYIHGSTSFGTIEIHYI